MALSDNSNDFDLDQSDPVPLDPVILRARDELLEEHADKGLEEQITFYKAVIEGEMAVEQMEFSENVVRYQTTLQFLTNKISGLMSAIKGE